MTWNIHDMEADILVARVFSEPTLRNAILGLACLEPRMVCLEISANESYDVGIGGPWACVQHLMREPWAARMAVLPASGNRPEVVCFMCGGQGTEVDCHYLIPVGQVIELLADCFLSGKPSSLAEWEEI